MKGLPMSNDSSARNLPATQGFVQDQIQDLKSEISDEFRAVDHRLDGLSGQVTHLGGEFAVVKEGVKELKSDVKELKGNVINLQIQMTEVSTQIKDLTKEVSKIDALTKEVSKIDALTKEVSKIADLAKEVTKIAILTEEQNARNKIALEGISHLWSKQAATEKKLDIVEGKLAWVNR